MEFCDLKVQYAAYKSEIDAAIQSVLLSSAFVNGPEVKALESELAAFCGAKHTIACANGTDAIHAVLLALGVAPGDEIIVPDFTFYATAEMVALAGAVPVFADIDPVTYNVTPDSIAARITPRTKGIIPVSLFGQMPDLDGIAALAQARGLWVMEDGAQSFGAEFRGRKSCSVTRIATTSFFPAKPLGCYGDGGAIFTVDEGLAASVRTLVNHGSTKRYHHDVVGMNSRLDSVQAAVLRVKLRHFAAELKNRDASAKQYTERLSGRVATPVIREGHFSAWAQYTIRVANRDKVQAHLQGKGIPTAVHYPIPMHAQAAFAHLKESGAGKGSGKGSGKDADWPAATLAAKEVMSLPMHGMMAESQIEEICQALKEVV
ncbi:MAG: DegT/DnrJ/EryC1/StrS family aminotransferase [Fibrobacteria bacterium]